MSRKTSTLEKPIEISSTSQELAVWWGQRPTWQQVTLGLAIGGVVIVTGGIAGYAIGSAIIGHGAAMTIATGAGTATVALGKAAIELVKKA